MSEEYLALIDECATLYSVDSSVVTAVCYVESHFRKDAISSAGAIGIMQIMPETGEWIATALSIPIADDYLYDPKINIRIGTYYLACLYAKFDAEWCVFAAYNAGEHRVSEWLKEGITQDTIPFPETKNYVKKVEIARKRYANKNLFAFH